MDQALLDRILRSPKLPTLPAVAVRILDLTQDVNVSMQELARTIESDQALAARVLRTVNSSFYGLRRSCTSINQALVMLGLSTVKTLALSFSLVSTLRGREEDDFDHIAYWQRSLYSAVAARLIAREARLSESDEAFLGALLQDIGVMVMYQAMGESYLSILRMAPEHRDLARVELSELEVQHGEVGAMMAQRWKLPAELIIPIKYHDQPAAAPEEFALLVRSVALANIACDLLTARQPGPQLRRFHTCAAQWFGLTQDVCDTLLRQITDAASAASSLFVLNIGEGFDAERILERASAQLAAMNEEADFGDREDRAISRLVSDSCEADPLTGVLTRRAMLSKAFEIFDDAALCPATFSVIAFEIDGLAWLVKNVDPTDADALLVETAAVLSQYFGPRGATIARWDGGTFMLLIPDMDESAATSAIEKVRQTLERQAPDWFPPENSSRLSWSAGVASIGQHCPMGMRRGMELFTDAVRALDNARIAGGGCTHLLTQRLAA